MSRPFRRRPTATARRRPSAPQRSAVVTAVMTAVAAATAVAMATLTPALATPNSSGRAADEPAARPAAAAAKLCARPGVLFCETFDALAVGAAASPAWSVDTQQGTLTVEPLRRGSRDRVLHARTVGNGRALLALDDVQIGNSHYGRMRVKVDAFPTAPHFAHFILVEATGTGSTERVRPVGGQFIDASSLPNGGPGRSLWGIGADGGPTGDWTDWRESATAEAGRWQCIEWSMQAADNTVQLRVDGADNPDLTVTTDRHGGNKVPFVLPAIDTIRIGWWLFQPEPRPLRFDLRYDDIVLSRSRIGCDAA